MTTCDVNGKSRYQVVLKKKEAIFPALAREGANLQLLCKFEDKSFWRQVHLIQIHDPNKDLESLGIEFCDHRCIALVF